MAGTVLLINPPIYDFAAYDLFTKPLGLLHIAAHLRCRGYQVKLVDALDRRHPLLTEKVGPPRVKPNGTGKYHAEIIPTPTCLHHIPRNYRRYGLPEDLLARAIINACQEEKPLAVLITSMMTYWYPAVADTIKLVRQLLPGVPVALGGVYATLFPDHATRVCQPDRLFPGSHLDQLFVWLGALAGNSQATNTSSYSDDEVGFSYDLYPHLDYATLLTGLGCPYRCEYCASRLLQPEIKQFSPAHVVRQVQEVFGMIHPQNGAANIAFADDALLADPDHHFIPIFNSIKELGIPLRFHTPNGLHCRFMTRSVAKLMYDNNFQMIRLSYEASDDAPRWQQASDGKISDAAFQQAVENLVHAGYAPGQLEAYLLVGLPSQTLDEVEQSVRAVHRLGVQIRLSQYSPIPGTPLFGASCQLYGVDPEEPLLHNNSILPAFAGRVSYEHYEAFKNRVENINDTLKPRRPLAPQNEPGWV